MEGAAHDASTSVLKPATAASITARSGPRVNARAARQIATMIADEPAMKFSEMDGASFGDAVLAWLTVPVDERRRLGLAASRRVGRDLDWRTVTGNAVRAVEMMTGNPAEADA